MKLNFFNATQAHQRWKKRLMDCVCGQCDDALDPALIAQDERCDLGQWLLAVRASQPLLTTDTGKLFTRLIEAHAAFHWEAAQTASLALAGERAQALQGLQGGAYARASNEVIGTLGELYLKRQEFGMV